HAPPLCPPALGLHDALPIWPAEPWACMEATGIYGEALLRFLFEAGLTVSKVNPAQIKDYARSLLARNKTDRYDAFIIAEFAREQIEEHTSELQSRGHLVCRL